ncbi:hypothetical protein [Phenylobacterium sp.]|uniref:hypothetical protein n=1 Tax=Phenylobacterium sp. TaxID=1871053 RepID=UPI0030F48E26
MSSVHTLLPPDLDTTEPDPVVTPQVFVRVFAVPSGMPWEQRRAAELEARHGAPVPIADLMHKLKRLGTWSFGGSARFAVLYIRTSEFTGPFETLVDVDGVPTKVGFGTGAEQTQRARLMAMLALLAAITLAILGSGVAVALSVRAETSARLDLAEQTAQAKTRAAKTQQTRAEQMRLLGRAVGKARPVEQVLTDLAWASSARAPESRLAAVHWDHGLLAVEARGAAAPFLAEERPIERSDKPIRPGVWLWGVRPDPSPATTFPSERTGP